MRPNGAVYTPTDTVYGEFNTCSPSTGAPITLAGTPSLRLERVRGGVRSEITGAGITLRVDEDDTGRHEFDIDLDDANISALAGDEYRVAINVGTVDGNSAVGLEVGHFYVLSDGLTTAQKADVDAEADEALTNFFATLDEAALQQIVDDLEDGGRLDLLVDAIKAKTDQLTFTKANEVDANTQSINDVTITGDGSATPFDV